MNSRSLRHYNAIVTAAKLKGSDVDAVEVEVADIPSLRYTVEAIIEDPADPAVSAIFEGTPFRKIRTINLISAPVGSPCTLRVNLAVDPPAFLLYDMHEEFLFEDCEGQQAPGGTGVVQLAGGA